ncbi:Hypothetical predicted protein [Paramuricea clavata]|uniref:Uncharacterized protein n=1 Tax=Paramuricea clavata TaxID=317549 RepID=A0A7D9ILC8_PARCT|nr:Hypothetical predicted protein [Paramuricea clavata]
MESEEIEFKLIDKTKKIEATLSSRQPQNTNEASISHCDRLRQVKCPKKIRLQLIHKKSLLRHPMAM